MMPNNNGDPPSPPAPADRCRDQRVDHAQPQGVRAVGTQAEPDQRATVGRDFGLDRSAVALGQLADYGQPEA